MDTVIMSAHRVVFLTLVPTVARLPPKLLVWSTNQNKELHGVCLGGCYVSHSSRRPGALHAGAAVVLSQGNRGG